MLRTARDEQGTERVLAADGLAVHSIEWSSGSAVPGRTVLLLHGLGAHTLSWEPFGPPLADGLAARVTAIDLVNFGRTRAPGRRATLETQRRLVTAVLEDLGPSLVVGNSMGATVGIGVAASRPDLVEGLVLVNPAVPHPRPGVADWLRMAWLAPLAVPGVGAAVVSLRARALGAARLVDSSLAASLAPVELIDPALRRRMIELTAARLRWPEVAPAYATAARSLVAYLGSGLHRDLGVAAASHPTLLVHGSEDPLVALAAARHAAELHTIELRVLDGMGHAPQLEDPHRLADVVVDWVQASGPPGWSAAPASAQG